MRLESIIEEVQSYDGPPLSLMEVCGTHTASIFKNGIRSIISDKIKLISGPGCPVCVTPSSYIDKAVELAKTKDHVVLSFGDMLKVPGKNQSLSDAKGDGAAVELMYSPQEVIKKAKNHPQITFIIAAVGFETTIPTYALVLEQLIQQQINNVKFLTALRRIEPALEFICSTDPEIDGYIAPGHVSTILGSRVYETLAAKYTKPFAVAGFEAEHILIAIYDLVKQLQNKRAVVHNLYPSVVRKEGNIKAVTYINKYFKTGSAFWRGLGTILDSGHYLRDEFKQYDAGSFCLNDEEPEELNSNCRCGEVITGKINPDQCPWFRTVCNPNNPQGPCMVSAEGACGIWYRFSE